LEKVPIYIDIRKTSHHTHRKAHSWPCLVGDHASSYIAYSKNGRWAVGELWMGKDSRLELWQIRWSPQWALPQGKPGSPGDKKPHNKPTVLISLKSSGGIWSNSYFSCVTEQYWKRNPFCHSPCLKFYSQMESWEGVYCLILSYSGGLKTKSNCKLGSLGTSCHSMWMAWEAVMEGKS
jgi:hypothetical protein